MVYTYVMQEIYRVWGRNLREQRQVRQLTQQDLADVIGVRQSAVSRWERGRAGPSDYHKIKIAKALHVPPRVLFPLFSPEDPDG